VWRVHDKYFIKLFKIRVPWVGKVKERKFQKIKLLITCQTRVSNFETYIAYALRTFIY